MACYSPINGYRKKEPNPTGKYGFTVNPRDGNTAYPMTIPCGYCIGCRLERSRQWALRCLHEASLHERNCFITLTFSDEHLQLRGTQSLKKRDFQLFMKRLRKHTGQKLRYYQCGEYGENNGRPHYHACIFGYDFPDKIKWRKNLWRSPTLEKLWPFGFSSIGEVTFESAAYTARYILKKKFGEQAEKHYQKVDPQTGEITKLQPEYTTMSRRPGIAHEWFQKYENDVYPKDYLHVRGRKSRPTKYYDKLHEKKSPESYARTKLRRKVKQIKMALDKNTPTLESQEVVLKSKLNLTKRSYENA